MSQKFDGWHKPSEKLPEPYQEIIFVGNGGSDRIAIGVYLGMYDPQLYDFFDTTDEYYCAHPEDIACWCYIPELPNYAKEIISEWS